MEKNTYALPIQERYKIFPTLDRKFYLFDYVKFTTIKDGKGKDRIISDKIEAYNLRGHLTSEYRKELETKKIPFTEKYLPMYPFRKGE
jgi:hypothetical protein